MLDVFCVEGQCCGLAHTGCSSYKQQRNNVSCEWSVVWIRTERLTLVAALTNNNVTTCPVSGAVWIRTERLTLVAALTNNNVTTCPVSGVVWIRTERLTPQCNLVTHRQTNGASFTDANPWKADKSAEECYVVQVKMKGFSKLS